MNERDHVYAQILQFGFVVLNQALESGDSEWVRAEVEMLHNIPSLIGDDGVERHLYFWNEERRHYIDWVESQGSVEARSRMRTYYEPLWSKLESLTPEPAAAGV